MTKQVAAPSGGDALQLPPVSARSILRLLASAENTLQHVLDELYETNEAQVADRIQGAIRSTAKFLNSVVEGMPASEAAIEDRYAKACARNGEDAHLLLQSDLESGEMLERRLGADDLARGLGFIKTTIREISEELLSFSRDDVEDISDAALACSRMWVEVSASWLGKAVRQFETDHHVEAEDERQRRERGPVVEEATEDEIRQMYIARGEGPPERINGRTMPPASPLHRSPGAAGASLRGRRRRVPARVLWKPLQPQLSAWAKQLPDNLRSKPITTAGCTALVLPFSGVVLFCLPGVLLTDHVLQSLYNRCGGEWVEVPAENARQMARLGWTVTRLSTRQGYRVVKRQARKMLANPGVAAKDIGSLAGYAVTHPVQTATQVLQVGKEAATKAVNVAKWIYNVVRAGDATGAQP